MAGISIAKLEVDGTQIRNFADEKVPASLLQRVTTSEANVEALAASFSLPSAWAIGARLDYPNEACVIAFGGHNVAIWSSTDIGCPNITSEQAITDITPAVDLASQLPVVKAKISEAGQRYATISTNDYPQDLKGFCMFGGLDLADGLPDNTDNPDPVLGLYNSTNVSCRFNSGSITAMPNRLEPLKYIKKNEVEESVVSTGFSYLGGDSRAFCSPFDSSGENYSSCAVIATWDDGPTLMFSTYFPSDELSQQEQFDIVLTWWHDHAAEIVQNAAVVSLPDVN